jgi:hypothetical protein
MAGPMSIARIHHVHHHHHRSLNGWAEVRA